MKVGIPAVYKISQITIDSDIDFLTLWQATRLASPGDGEALRKGSAEITNTEIAAGAAIVYAKLALAGKIKAADIEAAAGIPLSKLVAGIATGIEVVDAIAFHADIPTAHQNAPVIAAGLITTHAEDVDAHHTPSVPGVGFEATLALFQANAATGNMGSNPAYINDNNTDSRAVANATDLYAEVDFGVIVSIKRWRQFGMASMQENGEWKIEYYNLSTHAWEDWVTGIATRKAATWSDFSTETEVLTNKIRLVCTAVDGYGDSRIGELEVIL